MKNAKKARKQWEDLRKSISTKHNPFKDMTKQEAIDAIRKVREKLWEKKLAHRS